MKESSTVFTVPITITEKPCPLGGKDAASQFEGKIPVISCEGACLWGEIARLAANIVGKEEPYGRSCHGGMFTVPHSALAEWLRKCGSVVVIDGCHMHCHGRIAENMVGKNNAVVFDGLSLHKKYGNLVDIDAVPEEDRKEVARQLANTILTTLRKDQG
ncbi:MAG: putative zinc-binding protein [Syntrophobacteraceae bacterium]|jgi:uncharacterized metal-binding protein